MSLLSLFIGFVLGVISNFAYAKLSYIFRGKKREQLTAILRDKNSWINNKGEVYSYEKEPEFKIIINEGQDVLSGKYKKFPDKEHDRVAWVEVKYNDATLFGWNFMHLDGYRLLVPVPKTEYDADGGTYDYYNLSSPEIKVFEIIGEANLTGETSKIEGLKNIALILDITITDI